VKKTPRREVILETLELRQMMAFSANINFQPSGSAVPAGYVADTGATYANRGNGLTYGWSSANTNLSDRDSPLSPDQRYDTLNRVQSSTLTWSLAVPNGRYVVTLVSGDPTKYDGYYSTSIEGATIISGQPTSTNRWLSGTVTVDVTDGLLTMRNAAGASNNKVNFIDVQSAAPIVTSYTLFDSTSFTNEPDLSAYGMTRIYVTGNEFWSGTYPNYDMSKPNQTAVRALARKVYALGQTLVMDIEHWPMDIRTASDAAVQSTIDKFVQIITWLRDERPGLKIGVYGLAPLRDYWTAKNYLEAVDKAPGSSWYAARLPSYRTAYQQWQAANDRLASLVARVDYLFPSLYTFYDDPAGWQYYAEGTIQEARRFGKPVFPFLQMYYHPSNATIGGDELPRAVWRAELDTTRELADGAVIWGGWQMNWNGNANWWKETKAFAATLDD
jgi:hypothetical protein